MTSPGSKKVVPGDGSEKNHSGNLGRRGDLNESGSSSSGGGGGEGGGGGGTFEYFGQVYHLGSNKIGHDYCHLRFLFIRGKYVEMYKRDPHENPDIVSSSFTPLFFILRFTFGIEAGRIDHIY